MKNPFSGDLKPQLTSNKKSEENEERLFKFSPLSSKKSVVD
jgi:hypothetical protein